MLSAGRMVKIPATHAGRVRVHRDLERLREVLLAAEGRRKRVDDEASTNTITTAMTRCQTASAEAPAEPHAPGADERQRLPDHAPADEGGDRGDPGERQHVRR